MKVRCLCGHENHIEMPFDDNSVVTISCTNACRTARQLKLDISKPKERLSDVMLQSDIPVKRVGMLGY